MIGFVFLEEWSRLEGGWKGESGDRECVREYVKFE